MSVSLNKLRAIFNDQLFLKTLEGMEPTPRAVALCEPIADVLQKIQQEILIGTPFDAATADREFTIVTGELGETIYLPKLFKELTLRAPRARLTVLPYDPSTVAECLESAKAELAIGHIPALSGSSIARQRLSVHSLTCLASADFPLPSELMSIEEFFAMRHAVFGAQSGYFEMYADALKQLGKPPNIVLSTARLVSLPQILPGSDLIAIVPDSVARLYANDPRFRRFNLPFEMVPLEVSQFWHKRLQDDPASIWLRHLVNELFGERPATKVKAAASASRLAEH